MTRRGRILAGAMLLAFGVAGGEGRMSAVATAAAQATFETTVAELQSPDPRVRLKAVQLLKASAYPESAAPLARIVNDPDDELQFEAIAAELNIFLAQRITPKKRVGLIVEVRGRISAEPIFSGGPSVLGPNRVPLVVANALADACQDKNLRLAVEALYALGALANEVPDADRPAMLDHAAPIIAATMGSPDPTNRLAAVRVAGRIWGHRPADPPLSDTIGDATISALNDGESPIRETAMWALGTMKNDRAVQALGDLLQYYKKGPLAETAFGAMARIGHEGSMPHFMAELSSKDPTFRLLAIEGMSRTGDLSRLPVIHKTIEKEKNDALLLSGHFANVMLANGPIDAIVEALTRSKLHNQALQYLQDVAYGRSALFARHLQDPDAKVREDLVDLLGLAADVDAMALVEPLTKDREPDVAFAATRALARLRAVASRPAP